MTSWIGHCCILEECNITAIGGFKGFMGCYGRGGISRALSSYNPFAVLPDADRELLLDVLHVIIEAKHDWNQQWLQS